MAGVCKIEDFGDCVSTSNNMWSSNWNKNVALAAKSATSLDLVETVVSNMKRCNEGKILTHADCRKTWAFLMLDGLKENQLPGDGR